MPFLSLKARKFISNLSEKLNDTLFRFPLTIAAAGLLTVVYITISEVFNMTSVPSSFKQVMIGLALAVPISSAVSIYLEKYRVEDPTKKLAAYLVALLADVLYVEIFVHHADRIEITRSAFIFAGIALIGFAMPYVRDGERLTLMAVRLVSRCALTFSLALMVSAAMIAIVVALESLLVTKMPFNIYAYCVLAVLGFFCPVHFLAGVPKQGEELTRTEYPRVLKVVVLYIAMPFWALFTVLLYIYTAVALVSGTWPSGIISKLLIAFIGIGIVTFLLSAPFKNVNRWVRIFNRWFFTVVAPLQLVLIGSISLRIYEYGLTEKRFIVMAVTAWLAGVTLFFVIRRKSAKYYIIPGALGLVLILSVVGPWNMFQASKSSQVDRLKRKMEYNGLLNKGRLNYHATYLSVSDAEDIGALIDYIAQYYDYSAIDIFDPPVPLTDLRQALGIGSNYPVPSVQDVEHLNIFNYSLTLSMDIRDYDYFVQHDFYYYPDQINGDTLLADFGGDTLVFLGFADPQNPSINMRSNGRYFYSRELFEAAGKIVDLYRRKGKVQLPGEDLVLTDKTGEYEVRIVFREISCYVHKSTDKIDYDVIRFTLFIKRSE